MSKIASLLCVLLLLLRPAAAQSEEFSAKQFAVDYFSAWQASQSSTASTADLEAYLGFLADDIGHQHLPYDADASRRAGGKASMREGMSYYLGAHLEYKSELNEVVLGHQVVVLKYYTYAKGKHPQTGEVSIQTYDTVEVLEIENSKVAVIRKYSE